jgi:VCBS repeat-containing protein
LPKNKSLRPLSRYPFRVLANDGKVDSQAAAVVNITVTPVNDAPVASDVPMTTAEDTALLLDLRNYASDIDSATLTAVIVDGPANGTLTANADGTFTYTPNLNFHGADSFTYRVRDEELDSNLATVSLTVTPVNDAPVATDAALTTLEDTALVIDLCKTRVRESWHYLKRSLLKNPLSRQSARNGKQR